MVLWWISLLFLISTNFISPVWSPQQIVSGTLASPQSNWISISSQSGFTIDTPDRGRRRIDDTHLFIRSEGKSVFLNGKKLAEGKYIILPEKNISSIDGVSYDGPISVHISSHKITVRAQRSKEPTKSLSAKPQEHQQGGSHTVRVLLDEFPVNNAHKSWLLASDKGFALVVDKQKSKNISHDELHISYKKNGFYFNKTRQDGEVIHLMPKQGFATFNGVPYHGSFTLMRDGERVLLINNVDLEEYVCGVLRTESWPGWPVEVNKVFAITSRSYVMAQIKMARKKKLPYHVKNTNEHQTYQGMHNSLDLREAVDQTNGMFLMYDGEPVLAMFDASCGGIITAHIEDFDFGKAEYLKRPYACKHCKKTKRYLWRAEFNCAKFYRHIEEQVGVKGIKDVKISRKDRAGLVKEVAVKTANKEGTLTGQQFYKMFKEVKSFHFDMKKKSDRIIISGRGYGHHMGMCQWGAREMVRDGWGYKRILQFYYPGTQLMRLPD
jgi:stage II sporulation protein D